jgi:GNAT superfamily N-acetyltransferase
VFALQTVGYDHPDVGVLVAAVQREYVNRYGDEDATPVDPSEFAPPHGFFTVGYVRGEPVACGGWRARDSGADPALRDGDAEVKRMFVLVTHRGRGYARAILVELERTAAAAGRRRVVLETGTRQPEAMALYTSAGYVPMSRFGVYRDAPDSRCYAKDLPSTACIRRSAVAPTTEPAKDAIADDGAAEGGNAWTSWLRARAT